MRRNLERTAWIILLTAFMLFCLLAIAIPTGIYWYTINATDSFTTLATSVRGTVQIGEPEVALPASLPDGESADLAERYTVVTDDTSQAILTFFDDINLTMYSNTRIELTETQTPRFGWWSTNPSRIQINVTQGRIRVTSSRNRHDVRFDIHTPHTTIELEQGSYAIEVNDEATQLTNRLGQATVISDEQAITSQAGERVVVDADGSASPPLPAAQNLLAASTFSHPLTDTWQIYNIALIDGVTTTVELTSFQNRPVLRLRSMGQDNIHTETGIIQMVNKDVRDFRSIRLSAEVRLVQQSLPGGGQLGSEFPIMLHVAYKDANGNDRDWFRGFYYAPPPDNYVFYNQPDNSSERIARYVWYPYESNNLLTMLGPTKPVFITSVRIYASGWIYEAMVANISLLAEE